MSFWIILNIFLLGCVLIEFFLPLKYQKQIPLLMICSLTFISGFRYMIGADYENYIALFNVVEIEYISFYPEISFVVLSEIIKYFGFNAQMLFLIYSVLISFFFWKGCTFYLKDYRQISLAIAIFGLSKNAGFWESMIIIRQFLAIAIFFWASRFIIERKLVSYILACAFITMIHYTGLFMVLVYFYPKRKIKPILYMCITMLFLVFDYLNFFPEIIQKILSNSPRYTNYIDVEYKASIVSYGYLFYIGLYTTIICTKTDSQKEILMKFLYTLAVVFKVLFAFSAPLARFSYFFDIFSIPLICIIFGKMNFMPRLCISKILLITLSIVFLYNIHRYPVQRNFFPGIASSNIEYQFNFKIW